MRSYANSRPLTFQVTLTVLALALFTLALLVGYGVFATMSADNDALQRQKVFVAHGLEEAVDALDARTGKRDCLGRRRHLCQSA